MKVILLPQGG